MKASELSDSRLLFEISNNEKQLSELIVRKKELLEEAKERNDALREKVRRGEE